MVESPFHALVVSVHINRFVCGEWEKKICIYISIRTLLHEQDSLLFVTGSYLIQHQTLLLPQPSQ